jgi:hypothetical protein
LLVVPAAKADMVTVDLGTVAVSIGINASIMNTDFPTYTETYTYQQLLFNGPLDMQFDSGQTLAQVLAEDLGNANNGTLDYNFPFAFGASGSYTQNAVTEPFNTPDPGVVSFTAQTYSGTACSGTNTVGSIITLDPIYAGATYDTILSCDGLGNLNNAIPPYSSTTVTVPPLGTITKGDTTTVYIGEFTDYEWTVSGEVGPVSAVPEPASLSLEVAGIAALGWIRLRKRSRKPA